MKGLFRENALSDASSPEQLNKYIRVIHPAAWLAAFSIFGVIVGFLVWAFVGSYISGTTVYGVIFPEGGIVNVNTGTAGYVSDVRVRVGDYVQAGDLLAIIPQDNIINELDIAKKQGVDATRIEELINKYNYLSFIYAKHDGRITEVVEERTFMEDGEKIAAIMVQNNIGSNHQVLAFVPSGSAKNLGLGMEAQISPTFAPREEYGYMQGYISSIGKYPITSENIDSGLISFVKDILPETGFIEVKITLLPDVNSDNLIKWSNEKGQTLDVDMGTACKILIVTEKSRPVERLF